VECKQSSCKLLILTRRGGFSIICNGKIGPVHPWIGILCHPEILVWTIFACLVLILQESGGTQRLAKSLAAAAEAFLKAAPSFSAEETMRCRKAAPRGKWDSASAVSQYRFEVDGQRVREKRTVLRSSGDGELQPTVNEAGQLLLLFAPSTIGRYTFHHLRTAYVGPLAADVYEYRQVGGPDTITVKERQKNFHSRTRGEVWVDSATYRLLRMTMDTERPGEFRDHIEVDYDYTALGAPMPVSVLHREFHADVVNAETLFAYRRLPSRRP
jgi:hypothetical protein